MSIRHAALLVSATLLVAGTMPAAAQLSDLHTKVRVGNKVCFADHYHSGSSAGHRTRKEAERAAIRAWEDFTGFEYGSAWGRFRIAAGKGIKCERTSGWGCHVQARACRYNHRPRRRH